MKLSSAILTTICLINIGVAQTKKMRPFESPIKESVFDQAWKDAEDAPKGSRLLEWTTPANSEPAFKLGNSRNARFFSDWKLPTKDLDGLIAKIVIYDVLDQPIGQPEFVKVSGFWNAAKRPKNIGVTIPLAPGGITSSAQIWLVADGYRATTGMFKL
jgi:hypothetical protein